MLNFDLAGRTLVVTGGASGIGKAVASLAAAHGVPVAILDVNETAIAATVDEITAAGHTASGSVVDVRDEESVGVAVERAEAAHGPLGGAVLCAGISRPAPSQELSAQDWGAVMDVNLTGAFLSARAVGRRMLSHGQGGSIVVIGSTDSLGGHEQRAAYAASKHGVAGLVKSLAIDWGRAGVRVNAVAPGPVDTPLMRGIHSTESINKNFLVRIPLGRLSSAQEQAKACLFLLSEDASYISGAVLAVDGGLTAGYFNNLPVEG